MSFLYKTCSPVVHIKCILYVDVFLPLSHVKWRPGPLHRLRVFPTDGVCVCVCLRVSYKVWQKHLVALRCITPTAIVGPHNTFQSDVFFLRLSGPFSICLLVPSHDIMMYVTHQKGSSIWRDAFGKLTFSEAYTIHIDILTYIWYIHLVHNTYNTYIVMWCIYLRVQRLVRGPREGRRTILHPSDSFSVVS